jgi:hypothetical protein
MSMSMSNQSQINYNNINGEDVSTLYKGIKIESLPHLKIKRVEFNNKKYNIVKYSGSGSGRDNISGIFRSVISSENGKILAVDRNSVANIEDFIRLGKDVTSRSTSSVVEKDVRVEQYVSGIKIRLFYDEAQNDNENDNDNDNDNERSEWVVCTKSNVGGNNRYFMDIGAGPEDKVSYQKMFIEACEYTGLKYLNVLPKNLQYMFVMKHPKNISVCKVEHPELHLIGVNEITKDNVVIIHSLDTVSEYFKNTKVKFPEIITECNINHVQKVYDDYLKKNIISNDDFNNHNYTTYQDEGIMFVHKMSGEYLKCENPQYNKIKSVIGNHPKLEFRYAELWSYTIKHNPNAHEGNGKDLALFMKYFPEFKESYITFHDKLTSFLYNVYSAYIDCFIRKMKPLKENLFQYRPHLYELHNIYINKLRPYRQPVSLNVVYDYFASIPTAKLMFALNYDYRVVSKSAESSSTSSTEK